MPDDSKSAKKQHNIVGFVLVGLGIFLLLWGLNLFYSIPKESELIEVAGTPTEVQETEHHTRSGTTMTMKFRLAGHGVIYADHSPHYDEIAGIVRVNQPVKAWLSPRAESIIQPADYVPMYKIERDGRGILTYLERVEDAQFLIHLVPTMGLLFTLIGIWTFSRMRWREKISAMRSSSDA